MKREEFKNVANGTADLILAQAPSKILHVIRNGVDQLSDKYSISSKTITLNDASGAFNGGNPEDFVVIYTT